MMTTPAPNPPHPNPTTPDPTTPIVEPTFPPFHPSLEISDRWHPRDTDFIPYNADPYVNYWG